MNKIALPDGAWAVLRDPEAVTERQRRPLLRLQRRTIMKAAPHLASAGDLDPIAFLERIAPLLTDEDFDSLEEIDDLVIATLVESWSFPQDPTADGALDLPVNARRALLVECRPLMSRLLGEVNDEDVLDPESPTAPANGFDKP